MEQVLGWQLSSTTTNQCAIHNNKKGGDDPVLVPLSAVYAALPATLAAGR